MAAGGRERSVAELYTATEVIREPKITSVLRGTYRIQGPVEETEKRIEKSMLPSQSEKRLGKHSMRRKVHTTVESGTCNVCSAPCSSCMHLKLACMGSKNVRFTDETYRETATSQNSINDDILPFKNKAYDSLQHATSEASNPFSVNSSHDSLSENAESKENIRGSDIVDTLAESEIGPNMPFGGTVAVDQLSLKPQCIVDQKTLSNKNEYPKVIEGHDDNISCVSRANDVIAESHHNKNVDRKNLSCSSALDSSLGSEGTGKALISPKSELVETPSNSAYAGSSTPKFLSSSLPSSTNRIHLEEDTKIDTSKVSSELYQKLEVETKQDAGDHLNEAFNSNHIEQEDKSNESADLPDVQEAALQSVSGDESDEVEHDVKVCDICGDAGREDLLAICSKCSDGAEHTYCMREMLQKVPEGDWLCEECKLAEETENQSQDADGKRMNKEEVQISGKRHIDTMEVASASKRQAIETSYGSPKSMSPGGTAALSQDGSFKGLDKGKIKLALQTSFANHSSIDGPESARASIGPRLQTPKGTLLKSNSFSTLNSKPKVKLVDEVPQKQKGSRETSLDMKEGPARMISKSMSFKSVNTGRANASESKVKMLPSKFSQAQDIKALKQVKEQNAFESKSFFKVDHPLGSSGTTSINVCVPKVNQKPTPHGESVIVSSASNNKESKASQSDGKLGNLSRSTSIRKGAEVPVTPVRSLPMNGMNGGSVEQKLNQVGPNDEPSSGSSWTAERPSYNIDENLQGGLSRSRDSSNQSEKGRESSATRLRHAVPAGPKYITCQNCKEMGHAAEFCMIGTPRASVTDTSGSRSVREEMNKGSKLKAAIEAAMLKRPGIVRKKKESDQSDGLSSSNVDVTSGMAFPDQFSASNKMRNTICDEGMDEWQANLGTCSSENYKQININSVKQLNMHSADSVFPFKVGDESMVPSAGKVSLAVIPPFSNILSIPKHEYIWQGAFEVCRGGKFLDLYSGIQAHLSTCASPKVLQVVNQFPKKITLDEVPRLSTWPRQFDDHGAKEDNIALYLFAKDLESYEKSYKNLLDNMIRRDLALKGCFDGVEFLIFPSTQLPENCQRWNMLFFLWVVFRGRRSNCSDSLNKSVIRSLNVVPVDMNTHDKPCNSSDEDLDEKLSSLRANPEEQDVELDSKSLSKNAAGNALACSEIRCITPSQEDAAVPECRLDTEHKLPALAAGTHDGSNSREERQFHGDASCVREDSSAFEDSQIVNQDQGSGGNVGQEKMVDIMDIDLDEAETERNLNGDSWSMDEEASCRRDPTIKGLACWQSNDRKRSYVDLSETAPQTSNSTGQKLPWDTVDEESVSKKLKTGFCEQYSCSNARDRNSLGDGFASQICDLGSSSSIEEKSCDKAPDEKVILEDVGTAERYFFPVDSRRVKDFRLEGNSMPWKECSSNDEDQFHDGVPNLELALGAETKPPNKGFLPFFVGMVEKNKTQSRTPDKVTDREEEDGLSASLSLSLSFPFPDKEQTVKPVSKTEQLLPERHHVNTSLLLFGGFSDK